MSRLQEKSDDLHQTSVKLLDKNSTLVKRSVMLTFQIAHGHLDRAIVEAKSILLAAHTADSSSISPVEQWKRGFAAQKTETLTLCHLATCHFLKVCVTYQMSINSVFFMTSQGNWDESKKFSEMLDNSQSTLKDAKMMALQCWLEFCRSVYTLDFDSCHKAALHLSTVSPFDGLLW